MKRRSELEAETIDPKEPYSQPKLTVYGDLRSLTLAKGGNMADSVGGSSMM
jgi:hypothetical protein